MDWHLNWSQGALEIIFFGDIFHSGGSLAGSFRPRWRGGAWEERDGRQALPFEEKKGDFWGDDGMYWNEWNGAMEGRTMECNGVA